MGLASSKIFPVAMPWARKAIFSGKENSVGSRPSMKREKTFSMRSPLWLVPRKNFSRMKE